MLKIYRRPSGVYHLRGTHHGVRIDQSTRTRVRADAEAIREKLERDLFEQHVLGRAPKRTFADAAIGYMESGGERKYLRAILPALVKHPATVKMIAFGNLLLDEIDQASISNLANALLPSARPSTQNRSVYTPVAAVLNYAARNRSYAYMKFEIRRPKQPRGRPDWKTPEQIEWWLSRAGHLAPLLTAYVGTGARATEMLALDWKDVSPRNQKIMLWEDETKSETARGVDLQRRVRDVLPDRTFGKVWRNSDGQPWHDYRSINNHWRRITEREVLVRADKAELDELKSLRRECRRLSPTLRPKKQLQALMTKIANERDVPRMHNHTLRHTWATWAYAVTGDLPWVMDQGGWADEEMALRYVKLASPDLRAEVLDYGWTMRETSNTDTWEKPGKPSGRGQRPTGSQRTVR